MSAAYRPPLSVSQNYLKDPHQVARLLDRSSIGPEDLVYEIGPGYGILTAELVRRCRRVVAIEKDPALAARLRRQWAGQPNLTVHTADFLRHPLPGPPYKVFANIPFNYTSAIVNRLTAAANPPEDCYLVLQKEAAHMYLGKPRPCLRSILLAPWFELEILHHFRRSDFTPRPQVEAVLLRLRQRHPPLVAPADRQGFRDFVIYAYTSALPDLSRALNKLFSHRQLKRLSQCIGLDLKAPVTALSCPQWLVLFEAFNRLAGPRALTCIAGSEQRLRRRQARVQKVHHTRRLTEPNKR